MPKTVYYQDGVTKITDPYYKCICRKCLHFFWATLVDSPCPECGNGDVFRSFEKREAETELMRLTGLKGKNIQVNPIQSNEIN